MSLYRRHAARLVALACPFLAAAFLLPASASAANFPLKGWWPLAEGRGQVIRDWSGHGNNGFLGDSTAVDAHDPSWIKGPLFGSALHFDGGDYAQIPDSPDLHPQLMTVSMWFRGGPQGPFKYLLARGGQDCVAASYALESDFNGGLRFYIWDGSARHLSAIAPEAQVWDNRWHHAAGTWDGVTARLFIDGKEVPNSNPWPGTVDYSGPSGNSVIGGYHAGCDLLFIGDVSQVMVWSTALPIADIWRKLSILFNRPAAG
jgi:hypothetical protein